jgi:hypothetical protein
MGRLSEPATVQRTAQKSAVAQGSEAAMEWKTGPETGQRKVHWSELAMEQSLEICWASYLEKMMEPYSARHLALSWDRC